MMGRYDQYSGGRGGGGFGYFCLLKIAGNLVIRNHHNRIDKEVRSLTHYIINDFEQRADQQQNIERKI